MFDGGEGVLALLAGGVSTCVLVVCVLVVAVLSTLPRREPARYSAALSTLRATFLRRWDCAPWALAFRRE
jgi:purine-cytosine permease-like protein